MDDDTVRIALYVSHKNPLVRIQFVGVWAERSTHWEIVPVKPR